MATFDENLYTIKNAVYGKEMRPAIAEALNEHNAMITILGSAVSMLEEQVNSLSPSEPGTPGPSYPTGVSCTVVGIPLNAKYDSIITNLGAVGIVSSL